MGGPLVVVGHAFYGPGAFGSHGSPPLLGGYRLSGIIEAVKLAFWVGVACLLVGFGGHAWAAD